MKHSTTLLNLLSQSLESFTSITEEQWSHKPFENKWSKKEILGHLIDSGLNNLRRFIVTQYEPNDRIVYFQDEWVKNQNYQNADTNELIQLWLLLNRQIGRVIENIPKEKLSLTCNTGKQETELFSLEFLIEDYIEHLRHHLLQVLNR